MKFLHIIYVHCAIISLLKINQYLNAGLVIRIKWCKKLPKTSLTGKLVCFRGHLHLAGEIEIR